MWGANVSASVGPRWHIQGGKEDTPIFKVTGFFFFVKSKKKKSCFSLLFVIEIRQLNQINHPSIGQRTFRLIKVLKYLH